MKSASRIAYLLLSFSLLASTACGPKEQPVTKVDEPGKDYGLQLPPGQLALRKIDPSMYPDFSGGYVNKDKLEESIHNSLNYLAKPSSKQYFPYADVSHERAVASLHALLDAIQQAKSPADLDAIIRDRFEVYQSVGCDNHGTVLFTGYYRPIFDARLQPDSEFKYPLYKAPAGIAKDTEGNTLGIKTPSGTIVKCYTRSQIDSPQKPLAGTEIVWLRDRFEAYIVTVQGSGKLRMADGSFYEIGYAAHNGYPYTSIGRAMIQDGVLRAEDLSLQGLIRYFKEHPEQLDKYLPLNQRYVFFMPRTGGPWGSLNEPVTPYRSIATDKSIYPRACAAFFVTQLPARTGGSIQNQPYSGFAMDQDTGGAIRAAGRCDIFMGTGDEVGELAGRTFSEGQLYYVFVKGSGANLASPAPKDAATPPAADTPAPAPAPVPTEETLVEPAPQS